MAAKMHVAYQFIFCLLLQSFYIFSGVVYPWMAWVGVAAYYNALAYINYQKLKQLPQFQGPKIYGFPSNLQKLEVISNRRKIRIINEDIKRKDANHPCWVLTTKQQKFVRYLYNCFMKNNTSWSYGVVVN